MRELSDDNIREQAEALGGYVAKGGIVDVWLASKFFTREDAYEIRQAYRKRLQEQQGRSA